MIATTRFAALLAASILAVGAVSVPFFSNGGDRPRALHGAAVKVGEGEARTFVELGSDGRPRVVGVTFDEGALRGLPSKMNNTSRCFDKNGDGTLSHGECMGDYQFTLAMPAGTADLELPFKYATVNWNPEGHMEPAPSVWSAAHYDFHFFIVEPALIDAIGTGPCAELIDCDDFKRASVPLPKHHQPEGYIDVGAAVAAMGNHLIDSTDPEVADPARGFSSTFIYGAFDGKLIFLEPMVSHKLLASRPNRCSPVRGPQNFATTGYYPTSYCVRYDAATSSYRVTLEGMEYRKAE
jgi:hypothetical protein